MSISSQHLQKYNPQILSRFAIRESLVQWKFKHIPSDMHYDNQHNKIIFYITESLESHQINNALLLLLCIAKTEYRDCWDVLDKSGKSLLGVPFHVHMYIIYTAVILILIMIWKVLAEWSLHAFRTSIVLRLKASLIVSSILGQYISLLNIYGIKLHSSYIYIHCCMCTFN